MGSTSGPPLGSRGCRNVLRTRVGKASGARPHPLFPLRAARGSPPLSFGRPDVPDILLVRGAGIPTIASTRDAQPPTLTRRERASSTGGGGGGGVALQPLRCQPSLPRRTASAAIPDLAPSCSITITAKLRLSHAGGRLGAPRPLGPSRTAPGAPACRVAAGRPGHSNCSHERMFRGCSLRGRPS